VVPQGILTVLLESKYLSTSIFALTGKGFLRLRKDFGSRNSYAAQDDRGLSRLHTKPEVYGLTATKSGLQVIGTVPLPFCAAVVVTPELLVTVNVPGPKDRIV
jgi:hypothetical protein